MTVEPGGKTTYFPFPGYSEEMVGTAVTARRVTYTIAGQAVASRVQTFSPASNTLYRLYTDHLGSTVTHSTISGSAVPGATTYYLPYGSYRGTPPTQTLTDRDFTGQRENREIGLLYYNARFYVPSIGRFASPDTIVPDPANPQSFNRYTYSLNSPIRFSDPTGHVCYDSNADAVTPGNCNGGSTPLPPPPPLTPIWLRSPIDAPDWAQYYAYTEISLQIPYNTNGGQHAGLDYGKSANLSFGGTWDEEAELWKFDGTYGTAARPLIPVYAGCYCTVSSTSTTKGYAPGRVNLTHPAYDDYQLINGHLQDIQVASGDAVTPDTIIGYLDTTERHVHLEIRRISDNHFVNPFPYLSTDLQAELLEFQGLSSGTKYQPGYPDDPARQPSGYYTQ